MAIEKNRFLEISLKLRQYSKNPDQNYTIPDPGGKLITDWPDRSATLIGTVHMATSPLKAVYVGRYRTTITTDLADFWRKIFTIGLENQKLRDIFLKKKSKQPYGWRLFREVDTKVCTTRSKMWLQMTIVVTAIKSFVSVVEDFIDNMGPLSTKLGYALKQGLKIGLLYSCKY